MKFLAKFKKISQKDVQIAGGKGASLGEMIQAGIPVPDGFVLLSNAFNEFLKDTDINVEIDAILNNIDLKILHTVEDASEKIKALILSSNISDKIEEDIFKHFDELDSKFVAIRSSATSEDSSDAAWAGQLETYLNTSKKDLIKNIKKCWASLYTTRAIFYREEQGLKEKNISVAVVIQKMIDSEKSGVAFSVHPVTQDKNQILIEAGFGLGEAVVSGEITPDSYVARKDTRKILDKNINQQKKALYRANNGKNVWKKLSKKEGAYQVLKDKDILKLSNMIIRIEDHYKFPCDIEWAVSNGKLYILQSRPITTLSLKQIPDETQLNYYFSWGERHSVISTESWLRGYVNLRNIIANDNKNVFILVKKGGVNTHNTEEDLLIAYKSGEKILKRTFLKEHLIRTKGIRDQFYNLYQKTKKRDLTKLSNKQLLSIFLKYQDLFDKTWAHFKISQPEYLEPALKKLKKLLLENSKNEKSAEKKFITLTIPLKLDIIKEEELAALKLSFSKNLTDKALLRHGEIFPWLFFNTYDREVILDFLRRKFTDLQSISISERKKHIRYIENSLLKHKTKHKELIQSLKKKTEIRYLSLVFGELAVDRLKLKFWWGGAEYLFLSLFEEISIRAKISVEDLLMSYKIKDIENFLKQGKKISKNEIDSRKKLYAVSVEDGIMHFYRANRALNKFNELIRDQEESSGDSKDIITGTSANIGKVRGKAYIVKVEDLKELIKDMENFKDGDILVTTMTQPTMVSLARKASAIVTNEGGITSHASILAREFGIPCVVGTQVATQKIKDGDNIEVDGSKGIVKIL